MKKKVQVLLFLVIMVVILGVMTSNNVFATDDYSLSIETVDYSAKFNLMQRSSPVPSVVSDFENVHVEKYCYTGETFSLTAIIVPSNAYVGQVNWSIEQETEIAKIVTQNGLNVSIQGLNAGTCTIVCTAADGQGAYTTCKLTVLQHAKEIVFTPNTLILEPGDTQQIVAKVLPEDTTDKTLRWYSSNEDIAMVDQDGVVMGIAPSLETVTITCEILDGSGVVGTASVNVRVLVELIEWQKFSNVVYKKGNNVEKFYTSIAPNNATIPTLKYTSSDISVAMVAADAHDNSCVMITPIAPGKFNLICEATDGSGVKMSTEIEVIQLVEHITLSDTSKVLYLETGKTTTCQLSVKSALPANANVLANGINNGFIWKSDDESIATVDNTGFVTAHSAGITTITAIANDMGATSATCTLYVRKPVTQMHIDFYSFKYIQDSANMDITLMDKLFTDGIAYIYTGEQIALYALFNEDATIQNAQWQIPIIAEDAEGKLVVGKFVSVDDPYINPAIMTANAINSGNQYGYVTLAITCNSTDGSGVSATRYIQVRQPATSVSINKTTMTLYTPDSGDSFSSTEKLNATILPATAYVNKNPDSFADGSIIWSSTDENVAIVSADGHVSAMGVGEATIYGKSADGHGEVASCKVTVLQAITDIQLFAEMDDDKVEIATEDTMYVYAYTNQEIQLHAELAPMNASNRKVVWRSGDTAIATVDNGLLKIGNKPTVTGTNNRYVVITCDTTDGSGVSKSFYLYVLDSEYDVKVEEFLSLNTGDKGKLLLQMYKNDTSSGNNVSVPVRADVDVSISGNIVSEGTQGYNIIELYDENGNMLNASHQLLDVTNPSYTIKACHNGIVTIKFDVKLTGRYEMSADSILIGKPISFVKTCTINVVGNENRTISFDKDSFDILIRNSVTINTNVKPATATNYTIKWKLESYNEDYENPYQYADLDETNGTITGKRVGIVVVTATLYDTTTNQPIVTNGVEQSVSAPVYITNVLAGVEMDKTTTVYVGEEINLLNSVHLDPLALESSIDKSSAIRFTVLSGGEYIEFSSSNYGVIKGVKNGIVEIQAIATYMNSIYTSETAKVEVKTRLEGISLPETYAIKKNQVIKLTPTRLPYNGDLSKATITWTSSNNNVATVEADMSSNDYGFTCIVTGLESGDTDITVTVTTDKDTFTCTTKLTVIKMDVTDFAPENGKLYYLATQGYTYYNFGAYALKKSDNKQTFPAGCLENGASALSTVYLTYNSGYKTYKGISYPWNYPLRTYVSLERVDALLRIWAESNGYVDANGNVDVSTYIAHLNQALKISSVVMGQRDDNAFIDRTGESHIWTKSGSSWVIDSSKGGFRQWGYGNENALIFKSLMAVTSGDATASQIVDKIQYGYGKSIIVGDGSQIKQAYFTGATSALNVLNGSPAIAQRQTNAMSILLTYFPIDEMYKSQSGNEYLRVHAARQMLIWSVAGIKVNDSLYAKYKAINPDFVSKTENYYGGSLYYLIPMAQAKPTIDDPSPNYMDYSFGYSSFYYLCRTVLAPDRFKNIDNGIMPIVEGFVWKMDQVEHKTIPSFAYQHIDEAKDNPIHLFYDSSERTYKAVVNDTNGILNYFSFQMDGVSFKNNGNGTLTISVHEDKVDDVKYQQNVLKKYPTADSACLPEDNKYDCAGFTKWEMESEITQMPYTKADGSKGYAYMIGQNVQSQILRVTEYKSDLGDPIDAYITLSFDETSTYESIVESDVVLVDKEGNIVEFIIPNEQYKLVYTFTYTGASRGLKVVDLNPSRNQVVSTSMYAFAADMRARSGFSNSLIDIANRSDYSGKYYSKTNTSATNTEPVWSLGIDEVVVEMTGGFTVYNTPDGSISSWSSNADWYDSLYIDANIGNEEVKNVNEIKNSSNRIPNIKEVSKDGTDVKIVWEYDTGYITFTTPYVKATSNINIGRDTEHSVRKEVNLINQNAASKYMYGLTINGERAAQGSATTEQEGIRTFADYTKNYYFKGMIDNAVTLASKNARVSADDLAYQLFEGRNYQYPINNTTNEFLEMVPSLATLKSLGKTSAGVGDIYFYSYNGQIAGIIINIDNGFGVYWTSGNDRIVGGTWDECLTAMNAYSLMGAYSYETYITIPSDENAEGDSFNKSEAVYDETKSSGMKTTIKNSGLWNKVAANLDKFTMTNPLYYGGAGYFNVDTSAAYANNALNATSFHTSKTFMTVFDLEISNLVVNTGAGITSPTSVDTRNFVNLNVYYTITLNNDAFKINTTRFGSVGDIRWHYFKESGKENAEKYTYFKTDFFYEDPVTGDYVYCEADSPTNLSNVYFYDPTHTFDDSMPDNLSANGMGQPDFVPDCRQNIVFGDTALTHPAGWTIEKPIKMTIHTDTFTNFCIYDNAKIQNANQQLDVGTFPTMSQSEQLETLNKVTSSELTNLFFIDNIQTGENYIQHTVPYVLSATTNGVKIYGFSAHVNKTYNNAAAVNSAGNVVYVNKALAEWGRHSNVALSNEEAAKVWPYKTNVDGWFFGVSELGNRTAIDVSNEIMMPQQRLMIPRQESYYNAEYARSYDNNDTVTYLLQYPSYNPHTLSTTSTNGSLIYKNAVGITGFDIMLGNSQSVHIPNTDAITFLQYIRNFGKVGANNAVQVKGTRMAIYFTVQDGIKYFYTEGTGTTNLWATDFVYKSLNFYKYSDSEYDLHKANGDDMAIEETIHVDDAPASTTTKQETETETLRLTKILFRSTYTTSRNLGANGWVDVTSGSNPDAMVNAGKGFELKIEVTYTNNNLTDVISRYPKDSAQVLTNTGSATSQITQTQCNISPLTGQYGTKSIQDPYTSKVIAGTTWNDVFGANIQKDVYVIMNNKTKYVYSYSGVYGTTQVFDLETTYSYDERRNSGTVTMTYTMKLSPVNGFFGNTGGGTSGLATQNMKFYTDTSAAGTIGSLTIWTCPTAATPFGYPAAMRDRYLADMVQVQYSIVQPSDNVDNIVQ